MNPVSLKIVSDEGVEATIICDCCHGGQDDYFSIVCVKGYIENKKIYGIDPIQSFTLGWALIEKLTTDRRIGDEGFENGQSAPWRIESL